MPQFKLHEVGAYLAHQSIRLAKTHVLKLYMALGGVPYYFSLMRRGESVAGFVDRLFFFFDAPLQDEFDELFDSLFNNSAAHKQIVTEVAKTKNGLTRSEISTRARLGSGGKLTQYLDNLRQSGFLEAHEPLGSRGERYGLYRLCDMSTLFHLRWLARRARMRSWQTIVNSQQYRSWCGHAFEIVAWNHAQIDLLFDVRGGAVYLFEVKFCDGSFVMTSAEAANLLRRRKVLDTELKGRRSIIVCLLAPEGAQHNVFLKAAVDLTLTAEALFLDHS